MKIGYARVSTDDQNLDLQREALHRVGCERLFEEKRSGATSRRPALSAARRALRRGDVLVVWKLDRLGRSLQDLIKILGSLEQRGIGFCSVSDSIDTTTPAGKLVFHIVGAVAEFERTLISDRTRAGMQAARRKGRTPGRRRRMNTAQIKTALHLLQVERLSMAEIAARMHVGKTTVWREVGGNRGQRH